MKSGIFASSNNYINREFFRVKFDCLLRSVNIFYNLCDKFFGFLIFFDVQYLSVVFLKYSGSVHFNAYRFERLNFCAFCIVECNIDCFYFFNVLGIFTESFVDSVNNRFDFDFFNFHCCAFGEGVFLSFDINQNSSG